MFVFLVCSFSLNVFAADNTDDTFGFQVELYDSKGDALEGSYPVLVNNTREDNIGSGDMVTLKADDVAYVCGLPDGCRYEVKEVDYDAKYYKPDGEGIQSGTYASGMISKAPFSNFYNSNGYVTSHPVMPETGGGGVGCVIVAGVLFIVLAVGLCFKRTRKTTICLLLVCTLPAMYARADNYFNSWFDSEFSCPGVGLGLRVLNDKILTVSHKPTALAAG